MSGIGPNWPLGYIPTQAEWNEAFAEHEELLTNLTLNGNPSVLILQNLPTSDAGLVTGQVWNNGGFLAIVT